MARKIILLLLLCFGLNSAVKAQITHGVTIFMPLGMDTTCPGTQLGFKAIERVDTFAYSEFHWYTNTTYTGVIIDTFYTTALMDGDSVYCYLFNVSAAGDTDSFRSNAIIIHRSASFPPRVIVSLTNGHNPDCQGNALTFTAYPVNGGSAPEFQWFVDSLPVPSADSTTITRFFNAGDTVMCRMISNSTCSAPFPDTVYSWGIVVSHDSLTAYVSILVAHNPICAGTRDTFTATIASMGAGASLSWYVDSVLIPTALGPTYITDSLDDNDHVYAILHAPDACVINDTTMSNVIIMTVIPLATPTAWTVITGGSNPGCLDSPITFSGHHLYSGTGATYDWYVNGVLTHPNDSFFTSTFFNGDVVTYRITTTDGGCYVNDSVISTPVLMIRDSTPVTPWLSLISNELVVNNGGNYVWYYNTVNSCIGASILPGIINQTYNPHTTGYYFVVKDTANCRSLCSNVIYISLLSVKNVNFTDVKLYPNPTTGILNFDWGNMVNMEVEVYNIVGQAMLHDQIRNKSHHETDLSRLPEGNYFIVLRDEDGSKATFKVFLDK